MKAFVIEKELNGNHAQLVKGDPKSPAVVDLTLGVGICLAMARNKLHPHDKTRVVSFWFLSKQQNPGNNVSRKIELVSIRVNVTLV
jgi:hypothetical protein